MKLTPVIAALRARCPYFENRVAGAAQFKNLPEVGKLRLPAAYVVPGDDSPGENKSQTDYWQELKEGFSVVVILSNGRDERGQFASYDVVDDVRQMLFKALLGWNPEACGNPITYDGGTLLDLNRHELIYQFDFSVISELTEDDTRQQDDLNSLDELRTLAIDVDYLDPGTDAVNAPEWRYYWQVNMPAATNTTWMTCGDPCDSALRIWGDTVVECVLNKLCPSHTYVIFKYPE
ncbi:DUF2313 domain-containing protein [Escherichia coli]|nr:DUF2313 domain-containing protein [Escherichia coli]EFD1725001.1 DUF2313 domain-containing protein [Escherichia coli]